MPGRDHVAWRLGWHGRQNVPVVAGLGPRRSGTAEGAGKAGQLAPVLGHPRPGIRPRQTTEAPRLAARYNDESSRMALVKWEGGWSDTSLHRLGTGAIYVSQVTVPKILPKFSQPGLGVHRRRNCASLGRMAIHACHAAQRHCSAQVLSIGISALARAIRTALVRLEQIRSPLKRHDGSACTPGGGRGLQNRWAVWKHAVGGFDSHALPPFSFGTRKNSVCLELPFASHG